MLLDVAVSAIIGTSFRPVSMANGLMGESFRYRWALIQQSLRLLVVVLLIGRTLSFSMSFMLTLRSATVSRWVGFTIL